LAQATGVAFQGLYDNANGMRDTFANFWNKTTTYFKDKPILGYEIINEPWAGDIYSKPTLLLPGQAGHHNLEPFYDVISTTIRAIDPDRLIFYEPVTWGMIFNGDIIGSGIEHVPGGDAYRDKSVFSFHYYCWWLTDDSVMDLKKQTCDEAFGPKVFNQAKRDTVHTGGAAMVTEWGQACDFNNANNTLVNECNVIMDLADSHLIAGWTDWYFGESLTYNFAISENAAAIFTRTYAKSVAGVPQNMSYNAETKEFSLCYELAEKGGLPAKAPAAQETEIFVSFDRHYAAGADIVLTSNLQLVSEDHANNLVVIKPAASVGLLREVGCVSISPK
jgi:endoglycosylceramidase